MRTAGRALWLAVKLYAAAAGYAAVMGRIERVEKRVGLYEDTVERIRIATNNLARRITQYIEDEAAAEARGEERAQGKAAAELGPLALQLEALGQQAAGDPEPTPDQVVPEAPVGGVSVDVEEGGVLPSESPSVPSQ